jgi:hypothetical protein
MRPAIRFTGTVAARTCSIGALSLLAMLGLRYPAKMLPLLYFELRWKALWVLGWGLPRWSSGQLAPDGEQTPISCLVGVVVAARRRLCGRATAGGHRR